MTSANSARMALRTATSAHHDAVDRVFSRADLASPEGYGRFLSAQAAAHIPVEDALTRSGVGLILPDWPERKRAELLRSDLTVLGHPHPEMVEVAPFDTPAAVLGAAYVLEGSRLGGTLLRRSVPAHLPARFLEGSSSAAWQRLLVVLDDRLSQDDDRQIAIKAAADVFVLFAQSGHRFLEAG